MGNIRASIGHLHQMVSAFVEKAKAPSLTEKDLRIASEEIKGIANSYVFKKIVSPIKGKKEDETISLRDTQLNFLANYLGYKSYGSFVLSQTRPDNTQLSSCVSTYYCYVRKNSEKMGIVFASPVRISETDRAFRFELKGPASVFSGDIKHQDGCLFILMESSGGKRFYHIYKIGKRETPKVLQGVFAGVSTSFDPIGGRTVLIRSNEKFELMKNKSTKISELQRSKSLQERRVAEYFKLYTNNNIAPFKSSSFDEDDLGDKD